MNEKNTATPPEDMDIEDLRAFALALVRRLPPEAVRILLAEIVSAET